MMEGHRLNGLGFRWRPERKAWVGHGMELRQLSGSSWRLAPAEGAGGVRILSSRKGGAEARSADVYGQLLDALWEARVGPAGNDVSPPAAPALDVDEILRRD